MAGIRKGGGNSPARTVQHEAGRASDFARRYTGTTNSVCWDGLGSNQRRKQKWRIIVNNRVWLPWFDSNKALSDFARAIQVSALVFFDVDYPTSI